MSVRNLIWMVTVLCLATMAFLLSRQGPPARTVRYAQTPSELVGPMEAYRVIRQNCYPPMTELRLDRGLIQGMVNQVDEFSTYVPADKAGVIEQRLNGQMEETGLRVTRINGKLVVVGPLEGSPAHKAGLFAGWEITAIDDKPANSLSMEQVQTLLKPGRDEVVTLELISDQDEQRSVDLSGGSFDCQSVVGLHRDAGGKWNCDLGNGIYYIRIREFTKRTPLELHELYKTLPDVAGLVLDLRDNPGGSLTAACEVAERFVPRGLIARTVGRDGQSSVIYARPDYAYPDVPMIVLVNEHTASGAEVVAGTLQAHGRAKLLGQPTYGKWKVQTLLPLGRDLGYVYLTTGEYFLPEPAEATSRTAQPASTQRVALPASTEEASEGCHGQPAVEAGHATTTAEGSAGQTPATQEHVAQPPSAVDVFEGCHGQPAVPAGHAATTAEANAAETPATNMGETPMPRDMPREAATRPAKRWATTMASRIRRPGLSPQVLVTIDPENLVRLERLRDMALVMPPPAPTTSTATMPANQLWRKLMQTDTQLAAAGRLLREELHPSSQPSDATTPEETR